MKSCPKCGSERVRKVPCELTGLAGCPKLVFEAYVCEECGYTEFYMRDVKYFFVTK